MKSTMFIAPFDAMWREIGCLYRALEAQRAALEQSVAGLAPAALHARPFAKGPSIASLLAGVGAEEAVWLHKRFKPAPTPPGWQSFLEGAGAPAASAILAWLQDVREATRLKLMKTSDAELDRATIVTEQGTASLRYALHHLLDQGAYARGQIALLRDAP